MTHEDTPKRAGIPAMPDGVDPNLYYPARQHAFTWAVAQGLDYDTVSAYTSYYARVEPDYDSDYYPAHPDAYRRFEAWREANG